MSATNRIAALESQLVQARRDAETETRAELLQELKNARRTLREKQQQFQQMAEQIKNEDALRNSVQQRINALVYLIGQSSARKPAVASFLGPDDDIEVAEWQAHHTSLETELAEAIRMRDQIPRTDRLRAIQIGEGPTSEIATLILSIQNLVNRLNGSINKIEGGVFSVG